MYLMAIRRISFLLSRLSGGCVGTKRRKLMKARLTFCCRHFSRLLTLEFRCLPCLGELILLDLEQLLLLFLLLIPLLPLRGELSIVEPSVETFVDLNSDFVSSISLALALFQYRTIKTMFARSLKRMILPGFSISNSS